MNIIDQIKQHLSAIDALKSQFARVITDPSIPLEERWNMFVSVPEMHDYSTYSVDLPGCKVDWYNDLYVERHEICDLVEFITTVERGDYADDHPEWTDHIPAWKEYCLTNNYGRFCFDW